MELFIAVLIFALSLAALLAGGNFLVDSAVWVAKVTRIPTFVIGAVLVSFITTLPEVLVSIIAAARGSEAYGVAVGNAVGSVICNVGLIVGISAAVLPSAIDKTGLTFKSYILLGAGLLLTLFSFTDRAVSWIEASALLLIFVLFMALNAYEAYKHSRHGAAHARAATGDALDGSFLQTGAARAGGMPYGAGAGAAEVSAADGGTALSKDIAVNGAGVSGKDADGICTGADAGGTGGAAGTGAAGNASVGTVKKTEAALKIIFLVCGAAFIALGANFMVDSGMKIADILRFNPELMGVTFVAVGTSLPELVTTVISIKKKDVSLGLGNIIGANIINTTFILGVCGLMAYKTSLSVSDTLMYISLPLSLAFTLLMVLPAITRARTYRAQGIALLVLYAGYVAAMCAVTLGGIRL